ncbi:translation elongation factor Ts [Thermobifida fusca]|jgi:elongation factor Ts|uniref:Elongation factor Ts n=1 Tax=Thermobifida fusca TM51 TaxID=1169414 RepID=A0A9P2WRV3_THEFU|nr:MULTISPECIES: translation elongation factor Ts [Thermobifida]EOR72226.1 elongation factor Ts [Thermobifida fusca TM51]MBO2529426.1 elongation factor Ts [Thermobifida sp.]MDD6792605.1 translation elongation factor Ts [Thermobifida fusca]PPS96456.1 elongation factor Ts [Thermobifida fusca]PZN66253.1 MAG: elongation factor Ts [Thermobifida fusca]
MANYTAADVKRLRELTGAGMMACKKALEESGGDFDKAIEALRIKGAKDVGKRAERTAANGLIALAQDGDTSAVLLELNCETDFVAKNDKFQELAAELAGFVARTSPSDVPSLLSADYADGKTVSQVIEELSAVIGEKIELRRFAKVEGAYVASYMHKSDPDLPPTLGVLVELDKPNAEVAKDLAQQIAALAPKYISRDDVPADVVENERRIAEATAREEGKPEQALPKIVEGRLNGFFKDATLLGQPFVKDNKKTIQQVVDEAGVTVRRFVRFKVGQA